MRYILTLLLSLVLSISSSLAIGTSRFYHLTTEEGLSHTDATCVTEDSEGFVWIGTSGGLQCYDGYQLRTYDFYEHNSTAIIRASENRIVSIYESGNYLYIGSKSGLHLFDKIERRYVEQKIIGEQSDILRTMPINSIDVDLEGYIWVNCNNAIHVCSLDPASATISVIHSFNKEILSHPISTVVDVISTDIRGVWVILANSIISHLAVDENQEISTLGTYHIDGVFSGHINSVCYSNDKLYLRYPDGVVGYNVDSITANITTDTYISIKFDKEIKRLNFVGGITEIDSNGNLWCANQEGVVEIINPFGKYSCQIHQRSSNGAYALTNNFVSDIYVSREKNCVWITTWGGGINYINTTPSPFNLISNSTGDTDGISDEFVKAIEMDSEGLLWIATQDYGVERYDLKARKVVESYSSKGKLFGSQIIKSLKITPNDRYLFVGALNSLCLIDRKSGRSRLLMGLSDEAEILREALSIYDIDIDNNGNIWIATWTSGVYVISYNYASGKGEIIRHLTVDSEDIALSSNLVTDLLCDGNQVWISTDIGINRVSLSDDGAIESNTLYTVDEENPASLTSNFISCVRPQADSVVWVGTLGGGVNRLTLEPSEKREDSSTLKGNYTSENFTTKSGLASNDAESILLDAEGNVWIAGTGIAKLEYPSKSVTLYDFNDGLQSNTFKIGASYKDHEGNIYFGGIKGLNYFNPTYLKPNTEVGNLVLTGFKVHSKERDDDNQELLPQFVNYMDHITLDYDQNDFTIEFSALYFFPSSKISFRYRLVGFSNEWLTASDNYSRVSYANLRPGKYRFMVEASFDSGATWSESRDMQILLTPPWWWSWWSKIIYLIIIILVCATLLMLYNERTAMKYQLEIKNIEKKQNEENHQMKLQFFTNISHEFRTPLTIIMSAIEHLNLSELSTTQSGLLDSISRNALKMHSLITQLMDFRKTDTERDVIHATQETINPCIKEIFDEFTLWADRKDIKMNFHEAEQITLWFDREKLTKIIWNLISNAIKYTDNDGKIYVSLARAEYSAITPAFASVARFESNGSMGECVIISVRDSGIGIIENSLPKLFDRYFQITGRTSLHLGSGIGLAVAKNMVLSHNGNIIVSSRKGEGTEFIVAIPTDSGYLKAENRFERSNFDVTQYIDNEYMDVELDSRSVVFGTSESEQESMLIVEDNVELLAMLTKHFSAKYIVYTATDGEAGLEQCLSKRPSIILSDVMMPKMSGVDMCREIRDNLQVAWTPIILLTAKSDVEDQIDGLESGADLYLSKPFTTRILDLQVSRLINYKLKGRAERTPMLTSPQFEIECAPRREQIIEDKDKEFIALLTENMLTNLDNAQYTVNSLCQDMAIGRTRIYTKVKEITGQSLGDVIRDIRITRAAELLSTTDKNISEVIYEVGIGSNSHFSKAFKQRYGVTPSEYARGVRS